MSGLQFCRVTHIAGITNVLAGELTIDAGVKFLPWMRSPSPVDGSDIFNEGGEDRLPSKCDTAFVTGTPPMVDVGDTRGDGR